MKLKHIFLSFLMLALTAFLTAAEQGNPNATKEMESLQNAEKLEQKGSNYKAAKAYLAVELYAKDALHKASALQKAAHNFRVDGQYGEELDCLLRLTREHLTRIDFNRVVTRIYEIGDAFYNGHKDLHVKWLPFIYGDIRTEDAYMAALKLAPCAPQAPSARLRVAIYHMEHDKQEQAIGEFQEIIRLHPGTRAARHAYIELAALYCHLASFGDGDGRWAKLAAKQLDDFIKAYPDDPEIPWAKIEREKIDELCVKRLHNMAKYYHRTGQDEVAIRYLNRVVTTYGTMQESVESEKMLADLSSSYTPPAEDASRRIKPKIVIKRNTIPLERSDIIVVPENSDGRFLLPIRDLELNRVRDSRHAIPERIVNEDDL